mmetsp:Transcript_12282/g.30066  ORF Transcript_12282/g.30066 Transcript_12282/m.30066 type:complete len:381 (-) Transcript_12282:137-1279(-)
MGAAWRLRYDLRQASCDFIQRWPGRERFSVRDVLGHLLLELRYLLLLLGVLPRLFHDVDVLDLLFRLEVRDLARQHLDLRLKKRLVPLQVLGALHVEAHAVALLGEALVVLVRAIAVSIELVHLLLHRQHVVLHLPYQSGVSPVLLVELLVQALPLVHCIIGLLQLGLPPPLQLRLLGMVHVLVRGQVIFHHVHLALRVTQRADLRLVLSLDHAEDGLVDLGAVAVHGEDDSQDVEPGPALVPRLVLVLEEPAGLDHALHLLQEHGRLFHGGLGREHGEVRPAANVHLANRRRRRQRGHGVPLQAVPALPRAGPDRLRRVVHRQAARPPTRPLVRNRAPTVDQGQHRGGGRVPEHDLPVAGHHGPASPRRRAPPTHEASR